jgi:hypothetical protein
VDPFYALPNLKTASSDEDRPIEEVSDNGRKVTYLTPGQTARVDRRVKAREQRKGQKRYNRSQRKLAYEMSTRRQQIRILKGEIEVTPAMKRNLERSVGKGS